MFSSKNHDYQWYGCLATQHYLGAKGFKALLAACGSAREVYSLSGSALKEVYPALSSEMTESLVKGPDFRAWETVEQDCVRLKIGMAIPGGEGFPGALESLEAPPPLLFLRGEWKSEDARAVALVGTRTPTSYGSEAAHALARDVCGHGFTVVSGLALGIDAASHAGALATARGRTLAVIGCGLDIDYPRENRELREAIESRGAVISEHPPGTQPHRIHFPRRNKLISALSRAVIVVEAGEQSGALLTAQDARRQNKVLFAVPGPMFSLQSRGPHGLLRAGAALAASADDIVAVLDGAAPRARPVQPQLATPVAKRRAKALPDPGPEDPVLRLWSGDEARGLDALAARAVAQNLWPAERAAAALIESLLVLEMKGQVERLPGPSYRRRDGSRQSAA